MPRNVALPGSSVIVTPAPRGTRAGNRTTALRWAGLLRQLGIDVRITTEWRPEHAGDVLLAVHAAKTATSVMRFAGARPNHPIVVLLAGTDIYPEFHPDETTLAALERADALLALQPRAIDVLPAHLRSKARTIIQSATGTPGAQPDPATGAGFRACVIAHLRPIKAPLLPFDALDHVPTDAGVTIDLAGRALTAELESAAHAAVARDPRRHWLGELSRQATKRLIANSHACIVPSTGEGGANVVSEALAAGTPLLATAIPGNIGLLGEDWPGLFPADDELALGRLLERAATDSAFYHSLADRTLALQHLVAPARERVELERLLTDLFPR
ncbi:MAG: TIGR04348 family glycosyltransferase [bacterium]|nr:TIGR04348 family glycosyltransferase [bacterium]